MTIRKIPEFQTFIAIQHKTLQSFISGKFLIAFFFNYLLNDYIVYFENGVGQLNFG